MGTRIPFRFPMVDQLIPTVQFYDVSRLVSAPVEPRGLTGNHAIAAGANTHFTVQFQSLAPGGAFVSFLSLDSNGSAVGTIPQWGVGIQPTAFTPVPTPIGKIDLGGTVTNSLVFFDQVVTGIAFLLQFPVGLPPTVTFGAEPRFFVGPGQWFALAGPGQAIGDFSQLAMSWTELPASFEDA